MECIAFRQCTPSFFTQISPKLFITNTHSVSVTLDSSVATIPTLMLFKDGEVLGSVVAPASKAAIEAFIKETLAQ